MLLGLLINIGVMALYAIGIRTGLVGPLFLSGRLLHGLGSASVFVSAQALALHAGGPDQGGRTAGTVRAAMVLGVPVGLTVGGLLSDRWGDAAAFEIAGGAVALVLFAAWARVPDLRATIARRPPLAETLRAMADRRLLAIGGINFALSFAAGGMILTTLALLVHSRHLAIFGRNEQGTAGLLMGVMSVLDAAATPLAGRLGDRYRAHAQVACAALILLVPGLLVVGFAPGAWGIAGGIAIVGLGAAGLGPSLLVMMGAIVPRERRGTGAGLLQFSGDIGGMLGPLVGTALFTGSASIPYLATAVLVSCFIPAAFWLARLERSRVDQSAGALPGATRAPQS